MLAIFRRFRWFCGCAVDPETQPEMRQLQMGYYNELKTLVDSGRYDTRDDFTVVLQPQMRDLVPYLDVSVYILKSNKFVDQC